MHTNGLVYTYMIPCSIYFINKYLNAKTLEASVWSIKTFSSLKHPFPIMCYISVSHLPIINFDP